MSSLIDSDVQKIAALSLCSGASFYFLYQMYFNRNDNVGPIKSEDGVLNYRKLNFMPDSLNEIRYEQPKSAFGKVFHRFSQRTKSRYRLPEKWFYFGEKPNRRMRLAPKTESGEVLQCNGEDDSRASS